MPRQRFQGPGCIAGQLDIRPVAVFEFCRQHVDKDDLAVAFCIPLERSVFARIVGHRDDGAREVVQATRGVLGQLANPDAEIAEQM